MIELSYQRLRASCVGLDVVAREVSSRSVYIGSKDETYNELEPKLDCGEGVSGAGDGGSNGRNLVMWVFSFLETLAKNKVLKVSANDLCVKASMSITSVLLYYPHFGVHVHN